MAGSSRTEPTKVLITVMTYPHPSRGYRELVCTAGITEAGDWVRLYPVDYRYRAYKTTIQEVPMGRAESVTQGAREMTNVAKAVNPIWIKYSCGASRYRQTTTGWSDGRSSTGYRDIPSISLSSQGRSRSTSSESSVPPECWIWRFEGADPEWKARMAAAVQAAYAIWPRQKPLRKLPYTFHYVFECADSDGPHTAMCEDWELGVLFLKEAARLGSDQAAAESVKAKLREPTLLTARDTQFFMGTHFPYNTWLVLGVSFGRAARWFPSLF